MMNRILPAKRTVLSHREQKLADGQLAPDRAEHDRKQAADRCAFGGRDQPGIDAAERAGDQHREGQDVEQRAKELG